MDDKLLPIIYNSAYKALTLILLYSGLKGYHLLIALITLLLPPGTMVSVTPPPANKTVRLQPGHPASGLAPPGLGKSLHPALCQHMPVEPEGIWLG